MREYLNESYSGEKQRYLSNEETQELPSTCHFAFTGGQLNQNRFFFDISKWLKTFTGQ